MYCTRCGHPNKDEARYCANCGAALHEETTLGIGPVEVEGEGVEEFPFPEDELAPGQALLLVKHGPNAGSTFLLEKDVTSAGRGTENDVFLDDDVVHEEMLIAGIQPFLRPVLLEIGERSERVAQSAADLRTELEQPGDRKSVV